MKRYITELKNDIVKRIQAAEGYADCIKESLIWKLDRIHISYKAGLVTSIETAKEMLEVFEIFQGME